MSSVFSADLAGCQGIVFFDGDCRFCRWTLKKILSRDEVGKLKVCNVRSSRGRALMESYGRKPDSTFGYLTADCMLFDVDAYDALLNGPAPVAVLGHLVATVPRPLSTVVYSTIVEHRPFFSRLVPSRADFTVPWERYIVGGE
jgi:predicted DCC family thiol-disulfide oxidoreductase YuxK